MKSIASTIVLAFALSACVAHKITATEDFDPVAVTSSTPGVTRINEGPEGWHCFEPLLFVLSLGIIPAHCLDRYHVSWSEAEPIATAKEDTHFEISSVQGWVTLALVFSPKWKFGYLDEPETEIRRIIEQREKQ